MKEAVGQLKKPKEKHARHHEGCSSSSFSLIAQLDGDLEQLDCSILNWPKFLTTVNLFERFPLLILSGDSEERPASDYYWNWRNAETNDEWIALRYHIILHVIANSNHLKQDKLNLTGRSQSGMELLESEEGVTINQLMKDVFLNRLGPEAMVLTCLIQKSFGEQGVKSSKDSVISLVNLVFKLLRENWSNAQYGISNQAYCGYSRDLGPGKKFSVFGMFDPMSRKMTPGKKTSAAPYADRDF